MLSPDDYLITISLFPKLMGGIYFIVLTSFLYQVRGLLCSSGILPIQKYLDLVRTKYKDYYWFLPSIYWINSSDRMIYGSIIAGIFVSILLMFGIYPPLMLLLLYILYLSIVSSGQTFLSFGWDVFILEITCNAFFLAMSPTPNPFIWISINFLLMRFHIQAGAVKLQSRDEHWRDLTAIHYHYQTQPLPNTQAWFFYKLPLNFHKLSSISMFVVELAIPFLIFTTPEIRLFVCVNFIGLQFIIWFTGNLAYLNHMSCVLSTILIADNFLKPYFPMPTVTETPLGINIAISLVGIALCSLQFIQFWHHFFPNQMFYKILNSIAPLKIINRYGIFAVMTTKRYEIVIEGSSDGKEWKEYLFPWKPSEVDRRPRRNAPYHPRLDWQLWFLPFTSYYREYWFQSFLAHLLRGNPAVLYLLRYNPFPEAPPKFIRASLYDYVFSDWEDLQKGIWWKRTYYAPYSPTLTLS